MRLSFLLLPNIFLVAFLSLGHVGSCNAQFRVERIVAVGDVVDDSDTVTDLVSIILNANGQVGVNINTNRHPFLSRDIYHWQDGTLTPLIKARQHTSSFGVLLIDQLLKGFSDDGDAMILAAFNAAVPDHDTGLLRASLSGVEEIAMEGQVGPDGVTEFKDFIPNNFHFYDGDTNGIGNQVFANDLSNFTWGVFANIDGVNETVLLNTETILDGPFNQLIPRAINDNNQMLIFANPSSGTGFYYHRFDRDTQSFTTLAEPGMSVPGGTLATVSFFVNQMNESGQVTFDANVDDGTGGQFRLLLATTSGGIEQIAKEGEASGFGGQFGSDFSLEEILDSGDVVFRNQLSGVDPETDKIVLLARAGSYDLVAREGQLFPDNDGMIGDNVGVRKSKMSGLFHVYASLTETASGENPFARLLTDGIDRLVVYRQDGMVGGVGIASAGMGQVNANGQFVLQTSLDDGSKFADLCTPDLYWRTASGQWSDSQNWTLSLTPASVHGTTISGDSAIAEGPLVPTEVHSLTVGEVVGSLAELKLVEVSEKSRSQKFRTSNFSERKAGARSSFSKRRASNLLSCLNGFEIKATGVLSGSGAISGDGTIAGVLSPGGVVSGQIAFGDDVSLSGSACLQFDIDDLQSHDTVSVDSLLSLDGSLQIRIDDPSFLADGQQFLLIETGQTTGEFASLPEGATVYATENLRLSILYNLGDGDDVGLIVSASQQFVAFASKFLDGVIDSGELTDISSSDNIHLEVSPSPTTNLNKQIVEVILLAESTVLSPSQVTLNLEAGKSGGPVGDVIQKISIWNENESFWETIDLRPAQNGDYSIAIDLPGDLTRFFHPITGEVLTRIRWDSQGFTGDPYVWDISIDEFGLLIE